MALLDYAKLVVLTFATAYPFIALVRELSALDESNFEPCEDGCLFIRFFSSSHLPSTSPWHVLASENGTSENHSSATGSEIAALDIFPRFVLVRNGHGLTSFSIWDALGFWNFLYYYQSFLRSHGGPVLALSAAANLGGEQLMVPAKFPDPVCMGVNSTQHCRSSYMRGRIENHLSNSASLRVYMAGVALWTLLKIIHDAALVAGVREFITLGIGVGSAVFQAVACVAAFLWCLGAAEVFLSRDSERNCACYYQFATLPMLLSMGTPAILLHMVLSKCVAIAASIQFGDYLYFASYDVPYRQVRASSLSTGLSSTLVVPTSRGDTADVPERSLTCREFTLLGLVHLCASVVFREVVYQGVLVPMVIGPLFVRLLGFALLKTGKVPTYALCAISVLVVIEILSIAFILKQHKVQKFVNAPTKFKKAFIAATEVSEKVPCSVSACFLLEFLVRKWMRYDILHEEDLLTNSWAWMAAGIYMFIMLGDVYKFEMFDPIFKSLQLRLFVDAQNLGYAHFRHFSDNHPEFELQEYVKLMSESPRLFHTGAQLRLRLQDIPYRATSVAEVRVAISSTLESLASRAASAEPLLSATSSAD